MGRGDYEVTGGSVTHRRRGAARAAHVAARRSAACSSRCSTRSRCPACALERSRGRVDPRPRRRHRRPRTTRLRAEARAPRRRATSSSTRGVNVEFSGGEKKRAETLQLAVLEPKFAILDEIDSGLDVDALRDVARRVEAMTHERRPRRARDHALRAAAHRAAARPRARVHGRPRRRAAAAPSSPTSSRPTGYEGLARAFGVEASSRSASAVRRRSVRRPVLDRARPTRAGRSRPHRVLGLPPVTYRGTNGRPRIPAGRRLGRDDPTLVPPAKDY